MSKKKADSLPHSAPASNKYPLYCLQHQHKTSFFCTFVKNSGYPAYQPRCNFRIKHKYCQQLIFPTARKRLEIHYTPKHGSWLNIAEIELNVMTRQCLARKLDSISKIQQELAAWERMRNEECGKVIWHFTTPQARTKLISLYPKFETSGK